MQTKGAAGPAAPPVAIAEAALPWRRCSSGCRGPVLDDEDELVGLLAGVRGAILQFAGEEGLLA